MNKTKQVLTAGLLLAVAGVFSGCASTGTGSNRAGQGALLGSLAGAGLGAIIGHQSGEAGKGALVGAAVGGAGGYVLGNEQDKAEMQTQTAQAIQSANTAVQSANTVVVNVKNSNGSITPVTLHRQGNFYMGPKGELYTGIPTEDQLRPVYGF